MYAPGWMPVLPAAAASSPSVTSVTIIMLVTASPGSCHMSRVPCSKASLSSVSRVPRRHSLTCPVSRCCRTSPVSATDPAPAAVTARARRRTLRPARGAAPSISDKC